MEGQGTERAAFPILSPAAKLTVSDLPETRLDLPEDCVSNNEAPNSQEPSGTAVAEEAGFLPPLGKLDLGDLGKAPDPLEDWPSREEIQRFWKLRQEIVEDGQAGVLENQLLPAELPPKLKAALSAGEEQPPARRPVLRYGLRSGRWHLVTLCQDVGRCGHVTAVVLRQMPAPPWGQSRPAQDYRGPGEAQWRGCRREAPVLCVCARVCGTRLCVCVCVCLLWMCGVCVMCAHAVWCVQREPVPQ